MLKQNINSVLINKNIIKYRKLMPSWLLNTMVRHITLYRSTGIEVDGVLILYAYIPFQESGAYTNECGCY